MPIYSHTHTYIKHLKKYNYTGKIANALHNKTTDTDVHKIRNKETPKHESTET